MAIDVKILKKWGEFCLDIRFQSQSKRIGILGASGSGKSMTLKSIAGIETPDSGYIEIDGNILFDKETKINLKPQKRKVGYLFQNYALFPTMTVEQNIAAGLKGKKPVLRRRVGEMVRKFGLTGLENRYPHQLSGGQQQRTALARIMAYEPKVILLDEPFSALDMYLKDRTGRKGTCWPAIGTIARDLGLSRSTVKRALKDLEEKGYLKREIRHRENGGFTSNRYTIL